MNGAISPVRRSRRSSFSAFLKKAEVLRRGRFGLDHLLIYDLTGLGLLLPLESGADDPETADPGVACQGGAGASLRAHLDPSRPGSPSSTWKATGDPPAGVAVLSARGHPCSRRRGPEEAAPGARPLLPQELHPPPQDLRLHPGRRGGDSETADLSRGQRPGPARGVRAGDARHPAGHGPHGKGAAAS